MSSLNEIVGKQKNASPPAEGSAMGKSTPKVGDAPSKSNAEQPVTSNQNFTVKKLSFKKVTSGF